MAESWVSFVMFVFSRMRSKGSRFGGVGVEGVFARRCPVRKRPQPSATVRNRSQPSARAPYGRVMVSSAKVVIFFVSRGRRGTW